MTDDMPEIIYAWDSDELENRSGWSSSRGFGRTKYTRTNPDTVVLSRGDAERIDQILNMLHWQYSNSAPPNHIDGLCGEALDILTKAMGEK